MPFSDSYNDGPAAYYSFDGNANDESGNGNHGGGIRWSLTYTKSVSGRAARFDGIDDFIEIDPLSDVSSIGNFTISVWTYLEDWRRKYRKGADGKLQAFIRKGEKKQRDFFFVPIQERSNNGHSVAMRGVRYLPTLYHS